MPHEAAPTFEFAPVGEHDLALIARWLRQPHVARWWGDPDHELAEIAGFVAEPGTVHPYLIVMDGRAIGYIQSYDIHGEDDHPYADQPEGSIGIDLSIGEAGLTGRGIGPAAIDAFVGHLAVDGAARIVIDPHPDNTTAIRAYEKAGFRRIGQRVSEYGPALIMVRDVPANTGEPAWH